MSVAAPTTLSVSPVPAVAVRGRVSDYVTLAKPKIAAMALVTVALGYLAARGRDVGLFLHASLGILLVAAASGALNQYAEVSTDAKMPRTRTRPLPAGRCAPAEALLFGILCGLAGAYYLAFAVNGLTAGLAVLTLVLYVGVYTPLKRVSWWSTVIGAVPGALPPVLGWAAAAGADASLIERTWVPAAGLFGVLFLWQFPHFLAIAWLNREQYRDAGLHMLPGQLPRVGWTGRLSAVTALALLPVGLIPTLGGGTGVATAVVATSCGSVYLWASVRFARKETRTTARGVLFASLAYLPALALAVAGETLAGVWL